MRKSKQTESWTQNYTPTYKQQLMHSTPANVILYGGAAGGGKSYGAAQDAIAFCLENPGLQCFIFRRSLPDLEKTLMRTVYDICLDKVGSYQPNSYRYSFFNGSVIHFCHAAEEQDVDKYLGSEIHYLIVDEAVLMTPYQLKMLQSRCRLGAFAAKLAQYDKQRAAEGRPAQAHLFPRILFLTNPIGGPSREYLRDRFVVPAKPLTIFRDKKTEYLDKDTGETVPGKRAVYIPATMYDNPHLDKDYAGVFTDMTPERAKALRDGDWDSIEGTALHNLEKYKHMIPSFEIPRWWTRFMVIDWGTAKPFSVGWYAVSEGIILEDERGRYPRKHTIPEGAIIRYHEWYGWTGEQDKGIRWGSDKVAKRILEIEKEEKLGEISYRVGDYQMWAMSDGPSPKENMFTATGGRVNLQKSKKDRKANFNEVLSRLGGNSEHLDKNGEPIPMLFITENCTQWWRTVPNLTLDKLEPDKGPGSKQEDHCYDETGYACRSRPYVTTEKQVKQRLFNIAKDKAYVDRPFY